MYAAGVFTIQILEKGILADVKTDACILEECYVF